MSSSENTMGAAWQADGQYRSIGPACNRAGRLVAVVLCVAMLLLSHAPVLAQPALVVDLATDGDAVRWDGRRAGNMFGALATSCDINGDGISDWIVSAYEAHGPAGSRFRAGNVYVILGRRGSWAGPLDAGSDADVTIYGQEDVDKLGSTVACGDVDGDGIGDLLLAADLADGPGNSRPGAGQVHILLGRASWPSEVDLLTDPGVIIYGETAGSGLRCAVGEIDGDGTDDVVLAATQSPSKDGQAINAGRAYVLFGRADWPPTLDLAAGRDVTFYGASQFDGLGGDIGVGDADEDGIDDLMLRAANGDGPGESRTDAGEVYLFYGRPLWPSEFDLRIDSPDILLVGPDPSDFAGDGLAVGDVDFDGHPELTIGVTGGDGAGNDRPSAGEARIHQPYPSYQPIVDLGSDSETTIWGSDPADLFLCGIAGVRDVSGDGLDDLVCSATQADGPTESDTRMGEIYVFLGGAPLPAELSIGAGDEDWIIYGRQAGDALGEVALADVNGDGISEIIGKTLVGNDFLVSSSWLISPVDVDGDGFSQLPDNCPLIANPDQADADGDGRGDACALDWDGDGLIDSEDCAIADAAGGRPASIHGVAFSPGRKDELSWIADSLAEEYDVSRGDLSALAPGEYGACRNATDPDRTDTVFVDAGTPASGDGFFYLVRGVDLDCPATGSWGADSSGSERVNTDPAGCG